METSNLLNMGRCCKSGRIGPGWGIESRKRWRKVGAVSGEESDRWVPCRQSDQTRTDGRAGEGRSAPFCQSWVPQRRRASFAVKDVEGSCQPFFAGIQNCDLDGGRQKGASDQLMFLNGEAAIWTCQARHMPMKDMPQPDNNNDRDVCWVWESAAWKSAKC